MNGRWYINLFILRTTFPAVALEISGKGRASLWRYRESNEETRTDDRDSTESPELSVLCTPPHTHTHFFIMAAVSTLSSNAQIGHWLVLYLPAALNFLAYVNFAWMQIPFSALLLPPAPFVGDNLHQSLPSTGPFFFFIPQKQPTASRRTAPGAMVWLRVKMCENCAELVEVLNESKYGNHFCFWPLDEVELTLAPRCVSIAVHWSLALASAASHM